MPYVSAQDFYPPCVCCGDLCSGWRIIRKSSDGKNYKDWACVDCVNDLVKLKQNPIDLIKLI